MKKKFLSLCFPVFFLFLSNSSNAQWTAEPLRLMSSTTILNNYEIKRYDVDSIKSILFVFKGDGENFSWVHHFLSSRLIRNWNKKAKLGFVYDLKFADGKLPKWMERPKFGNPLTEYDLRVEIRLYDFKSKVFHGNYEDSYLVDIEMIDPKTNGLMEFSQIKTVNRRERIYGDWGIVQMINEIMYE